MSATHSLAQVSKKYIRDDASPGFVLPDLIGYCPFTLHVNPHYEAASAESDAWFDSFGIHRGSRRDEFKIAKFGLLTAMSYAQADHAHLRNCCDFMSWLFAFDDLTDDGGLRENIDGMKKAAKIMMDALRNPKTYKTEFKVGETLRRSVSHRAALPHGPLSHTVSTISFWERASATASEGTQRRFVETCQLYVNAIYQQVVNRRHDQIPTFESFIQLRRDTSAVKLVFSLIEYSLNLTLPDAVFDDPIIKSLEQGANDILTWANVSDMSNAQQSHVILMDSRLLLKHQDIYSFNVEQSKGDTQNLVVIAMHEFGLNIQQAVDHVGSRIRSRIDQYVMEKRLVPSFGSPQIDAQVVTYIGGMEDSVIGVLHWSFDSKRYFGDEHERIKRDRTVTLLPVDTSMLPPPDSTVVYDEPTRQGQVGLGKITGSGIGLVLPFNLMVSRPILFRVAAVLSWLLWLNWIAPSFTSYYTLL
ncbi:hypothetical protein FRB93_005097 [Tulasnella sp. JGI-2019a]|nr:hypothetical protein FRB93_005097 [Tulasnella sp. JGI-2019a]